MPHGTHSHPQTHVRRLTGLGQGLPTPPILLSSHFSAGNSRRTLIYVDDALTYDPSCPREHRSTIANRPLSTRPRPSALTVEVSQDDDRHSLTQDTCQGDQEIGEHGRRRLDETGRAREADSRGE